MDTIKPIKISLRGQSASEPKKQLVKTNVRAGGFHPGAWSVR